MPRNKGQTCLFFKPSICLLLAYFLRRRMAHKLKQPGYKWEENLTYISSRVEFQEIANNLEGHTHTFDDDDDDDEEARIQTPNADSAEEGMRWLHTQFPDVEPEEYDHFRAILSAAALATRVLDEPDMAIAAAALATATTLEETDIGTAAFTVAVAALKESNPVVVVAAAAAATAAAGEADGTLTENGTWKEDHDQPRSLSIFQHALDATPAGTKREKEDSKDTKMPTLPQVADNPIAKAGHGHLIGLKAYQQAPGTFLTMSEIEEENPGDTISSRHKQSPGEEDSTRQTEAADQWPSEYAGSYKKPQKLLIPNTRASTLNRSETVGTKSMDMLLETRTSSRTKAVNSTGGHKKRGSLIRNRDRKIDADEWEKERMARISKRYEKQKSKILSWENKKQIKARHWQKRIETKLQLQRERNTQKYTSEMERIDQIARGVRAIAEEKRRNDISKIRAKANKIRSTGKVPGKCFGF